MAFRDPRKSTVFSHLVGAVPGHPEGFCCVLACDSFEVIVSGTSPPVGPALASLREVVGGSEPWAALSPVSVHLGGPGDMRSGPLPSPPSLTFHGGKTSLSGVLDSLETGLKPRSGPC